jgi:biotin carboxylase
LKKILLLGGSHRDIPLIIAAQKMGYFVITLGDRDYYLGHDYANKYFKVNFNNLPKVKNIIQNEKVDFLLPGSGEESYLRTVQLAEELDIGNFDSIEIAKIVHNKWKFKEFCLANSISTPRGFFLTEVLDLDRIEFPIIVKPTNLSGGTGVEVVHDNDSMNSALDKAKSLSNEIFLEEYIEGKLIAYSIIIENKKIVYGFTGRDESYKNKYLITSAYPIKLKEVTQKKLHDDVEKIATILSLVDGMFHLQVIIKDDIPYIIDVTRRIPGDFYPYLIEYCDKINYSEVVVRSYIGLPLNIEFDFTKNQDFVIRHCVMANKNGTFKEIKIDENLKHQVIFRIDLMSQNTIVKNFLTDQIAIVFIKLPVKDESVVKNINKLIQAIIVS